MAPGASLQCMVLKHLVAGQRGFDGDFGRLGVADFADHDDVRVLAQDGAQRVGEGEADFLFDRHLVDAGDLELDRVFDGDDVVNRVVEFVERGIERGGLAGAGRAGDENQAVRRVHGGFELLERVRVQAELVDAGGEIGFVQHAQHDLLAVHRGHDGNAQVVVLAADADAHAPVLRQAALGDVQAAHDLEARGQRQLHLLGRRRRVHQHAVDAVAQPQRLLERLDVDVAGAVFDGLDQDEVGQFDDRALPRWRRPVGRG